MRRLRLLLSLLLAVAGAVAVPARAQGTRIKDLPLTTTIPTDGRIALDASTFTALRGVSIAQLATNLGAAKLNTTNGVASGLTVDGARPNLMVASVDAMRALTTLVDGQIVTTAGRNSSITGGGASYLWTAGITTATNLGTCFGLLAGGTGRFTLLGDPSDIRLWGALAGISDSTPAIQAAIDALTASTFGGAAKPRIFIPGYQYHVYSTITLQNPVLFEGEAIEANSINVFEYSLNGSTLVSHITNGSPIIHITGTDIGDGSTVIQGIEIQNLGLDGSTAEGDGIWFDANFNIGDVRLQNIVIRNVGGSAFRSGDGTLTGSPRWGYSRLQKLTAIYPRRDGFELFSRNFSSVSMVFDSLYVNGAGRTAFHFVNIGSFEANNLVENNSAQLEPGYGMRLWNCNEGHFKGLYLEGDGRVQGAGDSLAPTFSAAALLLEGSAKMLFQNAHFMSASGYITNFASGGLVHIKSSIANSGFSARDSSGNIFENPYIVSYVYGTSAATATAAGSGGSLGAGMYSYRVTSVYTNSAGYWETPLAASGEVSVRAVASDSITLTNLPVADTTIGTLYGRKIWRTGADGSTYKLRLSTTNNVSTYALTDTTADGSLGTNAVFSPLVLIEASNGQNRFIDSVFTYSPLIVNSGPQNEFINSRVGTIEPDFQPLKGASSFSSTAGYANAARFFWGADSNGLMNGNGITRYQNKRLDLMMPGYSSRAFGEESISVISATASAGANQVIIGGNGTDYGATEVVVNTTAVAGTTATRRVAIDATGVAVANALGVGGITTLTNNLIVGGTTKLTNTLVVDGATTLSNTATVVGAATFNSTVGIAGTTRHAADVILPDGGSVRFTNSVSGNAEIALNQTGSAISLGPNSGTGTVSITPGTGGLNFGAVSVAGPIYVKRPVVATAGATLQNSRIFDLEASYWNGASATTVDVYSIVKMDSTAPSYSYRLNFNGTDSFIFKSDGSLSVPVASGTAPLVIASTTKVANFNADLFDGLDSVVFQPASAALTNYVNGALSGSTLSLSGTLGVGGATTLTNTLAVTGAATFSSTLSAAGITVSGANDVRIPNNQSLRINNIIALYQYGSDLSVGPNSGTGYIELTPGTGGIKLGAVGVAGDIVAKRPAVATAGATLQNSRRLDFEASYWNGSAAVAVDGVWKLSMDSTAPTYSMRLNLSGTDNFIFKSDGSLSIPVTTGTAPFTVASTTLVSNLNADRLDGLHKGGIQPASANLTNVAALTAQSLPSTIISVTENTQTGTTYTVLSTDNGKVVTLNNAAAITVTVPTLSAGFSCTFIQKGAGQVTFSASGTTVSNAHSQTKTFGQYAAVTLYGLSSTTFVLAGDTGT